MPDLDALGWNESWAEQFEPHRADGLKPGRVSVQHRGQWDVVTEAAELRCEIPGRMFHESSAGELPAVGDWVAVEPRLDGLSTIRAVLPRRSAFVRKQAGDTTVEQVLAANVDVVFLVQSLNEDLNPRRLERYLILAWESGASPVVLLTKSDLVDDVGPAVAEIELVARGVPVHALSARTGDGVAAVREHLGPGVTGALLGSSGVGKSTLINALLGDELLATQELRSDGKGRHTTTRRELILLDGGLLVDTPGIRELQLWEAGEGLEDAFDDVAELAGRCRFSDCAHDSEPDCAIKAALADGSLAAERWESYLKLEAELAALERKLDKRAAAEYRKQWRNFSKELRERARIEGRDA